MALKMSDNNEDKSAIDKLISHIVSNQQISSRISSVRELFENEIRKYSLYTLQTDILNKVSPSISNMMENVFTANETLAQQNCDLPIDKDTLYSLEENLQMMKMILSSMNDFLQFVQEEQLDISYLHELIHVNNFICLAFMHCKNSNTIYHVYVSRMKELANLFKTTQEVHNKMIAWFETQIINFKDALPHNLIVEMLNCLCESGEILFCLNRKSMLATWRSYSNLLKKYGCVNGYEPNKPLIILLNQVQSEITNIIETDGTDLNTFKVCNSLLRVAKTILSTFWKECFNKQVWNVLSELYKYGFNVQTNEENVKLLETYIYHEIDEVLHRYIQDLSKISVRDDFEEFINLVKAVIIRAKLFNSPKATYNFLERLLSLICNNSQQIFFQEENYFSVCTKIVATILATNQNEFVYFEILLSNMLQGNVQQSRFVQDLWLTILMNATPTICYETIIAIVDKYRTASLGEFSRLPYLKLRGFLASCYEILSDALKCKFLAAYTPEEHINVWALCSIRDLPLGRDFLAGVIVKNVLKRTTDLNYLKNGLNTLANLLPKYSVPLENTKLAETVLNLWYGLTMAKKLEGDLLRYFFVDALQPMLIVLIAHMHIDDAQLLKILNHMKTLASPPICTEYKVVICQILSAIASTEADEHSAMVFVAIAELLKILKTSQDENGLIVKVHNQFNDNAAWEKNLNNFPQTQVRETLTLLQNNDENVEVQKQTPIVKDTTRNKKPKRLPGLPTFVRPLHSVCAINKGKINEDPHTEIQDILDNMKDEVKQLHKLARSGKIDKLSAASSRDVFTIINKLNQIM